MTSPKHVWISSDYHFNHKNIIGYCSRPFENVNEMNKRILDEVNSLVTKRDLLIFLGDFAMASRPAIIEWTKQIRTENKIIVLGNHDNYLEKWWIEAGWAWASRYPFFYNDFIMFSHEQKFMQPNGPYINVHGHVHNSLPYRPAANYWNVSVDVTDFKPVQLCQILDEVKKEAVNIKP